MKTCITAASWSSGRVQDSGLGSRSSPGFNTLLVRLLVVPLSKALHAALLLSTQEEMGTCEGRFVSRGAKLSVSGCILPRELRGLSRRIWTVKGPMTREGTCQSLQSRALSLDVDSKQWLYFMYSCFSQKIRHTIQTFIVTYLGEDQNLFPSFNRRSILNFSCPVFHSLNLTLKTQDDALWAMRTERQRFERVNLPSI